jgi:hypothetical protein
MNGWTSVMNHRFDTLGFAPGYVCEVDPELPRNGQWACPWAAGLGCDGDVSAGSESSA